MILSQPSYAGDKLKLVLCPSIGLKLIPIPKLLGKSLSNFEYTTCRRKKNQSINTMTPNHHYNWIYFGDKSVNLIFYFFIFSSVPYITIDQINTVYCNNKIGRYYLNGKCHCHRGTGSSAGICPYWSYLKNALVLLNFVL